MPWYADGLYLKSLLRQSKFNAKENIDPSDDIQAMVESFDVFHIPRSFLEVARCGRSVLMGYV